MAKVKQNFYRLNRIMKENCEYNLLLGERSNGNSYAVKEYCVEQSFKEGKKFILLRRWGVEIKKDLIDSYFSDCPVRAITNGEYEFITYNARNLYLANMDENGKIIKGTIVGYVRELTAEEHYKSGSYLDVENIIYEEFISKNGYLPREVLKLQSFVSTVARKRKIQVFLIGNTISRICPYFSEWQLKNIPKMKQGQIDRYVKHTNDIDPETGEEILVHIAVEFCESSNTVSKMFFGTGSKMTTTGSWECAEYKHLEDKIDFYKNRFSFVLEYDSNKFLCSFLQHRNRRNVFIWYVEEKTTDIQKNTRIVSNKIYENYLATTWFYPLNDFEKNVFNLLLQDKVCFCNNLTGAEFKQCLKQME